MKPCTWLLFLHLFPYLILSGNTTTTDKMPLTATHVQAFPCKRIADPAVYFPWCIYSGFFKFLCPVPFRNLDCLCPVICPLTRCQEHKAYVRRSVCDRVISGRHRPHCHPDEWSIAHSCHSGVADLLSSLESLNLSELAFCPTDELHTSQLSP